MVLPAAAASALRTAPSRRRPSCRSAPPATVKALTVDMVQATGAEIILGNTYHLMLRPGAERVAGWADCTAHALAAADPDR